MNCIICNKELLKGNQTKYCCTKCNQKSYYLRHKEKIKANVRKWELENPKRRAKNAKKSCDKFRTEKRERFNALIMKSYYKHKDKWNSRKITWNLIKLKKPSGIIKECRECKSKENLSLKFEVYPTKADAIRKAIKKGKIYYLCKECRFK